jgi:hypothetical protein
VRSLTATVVLIDRRRATMAITASTDRAHQIGENRPVALGTARGLEQDCRSLPWLSNYFAGPDHGLERSTSLSALSRKVLDGTASMSSPRTSGYVRPPILQSPSRRTAEVGRATVTGGSANIDGTIGSMVVERFVHLGLPSSRIPSAPHPTRSEGAHGGKRRKGRAVSRSPGTGKSVAGTGVGRGLTWARTGAVAGTP